MKKYPATIKTKKLWMARVGTSDKNINYKFIKNSIKDCEVTAKYWAKEDGVEIRIMSIIEYDTLFFVHGSWRTWSEWMSLNERKNIINPKMKLYMKGEK